MLLRHLVHQWMRQTAGQRLREMAADAAQDAQHRFTSVEDQAAAIREQAGPCDVVLVFALGVESGGTVDRLQDSITMRCPNFVEHAGRFADRRVAVVESGVGRKAAAAATADAVVLHRPAWVISTGFAGALQPELRRGHLLMADEVVDVQQQRLAIDVRADRAPDETPRWLHSGRLLTVDRVVRAPADKRRLAAEHGALACDMETVAVAELCRRERLRFLSIRVISDAVEDELPVEIERLLDQKSLAARLGAATGAILKRPSSVVDMWKLHEEAVKASDRLAKFLAGVVGQLDPAPPSCDG
jgi:adenosylhomocysteine nucleosidase